MKIVLKNDVKDLGKAGDIVNVKSGYARNFLFPKKLAFEASEKNQKQMTHLNKLAQIKKKKAVGDRKELAAKLEGVTVAFEQAASETEKLFGSVTSYDVSLGLSKLGFEVDKKDIKLEPIKVVGQHKAVISFGDDIQTEITVAVSRKAKTS